MTRATPALAAAVAALLLPLAACAPDGGSAGEGTAAGCAETACADEVRAWVAEVRRIPGVAATGDGAYAEARTLRREATVDLEVTLDQAAMPRADEIVEAVAEAAWRSEIAPLGGVVVSYLPEGGRSERLETETFSFVLHEDEYAERWGPRPVS